MKTTLRFGALALLVATTSFVAQAAEDGAAATSTKASTTTSSGPLAKVNGTAIPGALADWLISEQAAQGAPVDDQLRARVRQHLIQREALLQEARKTGLEKDAAVRQRMDYVRDDQLVNAYLQEWSKKNPVSDAQVRVEYDKKIKALGDTEYSARHILVEKEDEAKAIIQKLGKGEKFAELAKASKDPGSKDKGGDLGWSRPNAFVPEFAQALAKLTKGKYTTTPVKTQFGYHVIMLDNSRKASNPKFEEVKAQLSQGMQQEAVQKHVGALVAKAKVE